MLLILQCSLSVLTHKRSLKYTKTNMASLPRLGYSVSDMCLCAIAKIHDKSFQFVHQHAVNVNHYANPMYYASLISLATLPALVFLLLPPLLLLLAFCATGGGLAGSLDCSLEAADIRFDLLIG